MQAPPKLLNQDDIGTKLRSLREATKNAKLEGLRIKLRIICILVETLAVYYTSRVPM